MDELVVKKLAVAGAMCLLLACQNKVARRMNSYAGAHAAWMTDMHPHIAGGWGPCAADLPPLSTHATLY